MDIKLRHFRPDDFDAFHAMNSDFEVVKMTATWPFPADEAFTRMRMNTPEAKAGLVNAIEVEGVFAGSIGGVNGGLGYMLRREFWGRGIMTQAVGLKIGQSFSDPDLEELKACVWHDNPASARVLEKVGFKSAFTCKDYCKARDAEMDAIHYKLSRADWRRLDGAS